MSDQKKPTNLKINADLLSEAKVLGINLSQEHSAIVAAKDFLLFNGN